MNRERRTFSCDVHLALVDRRLRQRQGRRKGRETFGRGSGMRRSFSPADLLLTPEAQRFFARSRPLAMAPPCLWWFSMLVLLGEMPSQASATNYQPRYYRRICYRPHCYHGYRGYQGYNVGHLSAGKCRRGCSSFEFLHFFLSLEEEK